MSLIQLEQKYYLGEPLMSSHIEQMKFANRFAVGLWKIIYRPLFICAGRQILKGRFFNLQDQK
jgi:hypothetical protein